MALEFKLPDIGEGVVEGEVVRWLIGEGDAIREDQPMVEVMTDKATVEIPSPRTGRVARILAPAGKICAVGQVMLVIEESGDAAAAAGAAKAADGTKTALAQSLGAVSHAGPRSVTAAHQTVPANWAAGGAGGGIVGKVLATPATRQLARELHVDLRRLRGSGPGGRVTKDDVKRAIAGAAASTVPGDAHVPAAPAAQRGAAAPGAGPAASVSATGPAPVSATGPAPVSATGPASVLATGPASVSVVGAADERVPFRGVRRKIADNLIRSKHTAAHFTYVEECDATELSALRQRARKRAEERGVKLSFLPFIIKAVVAGLKKFPIVNSTLDTAADEIVLRKQYHIGVAAATDAGLVVPVLRDADQLSLFQMATQLDALSEKVRTGKASRDEITGSTFTISSLGTLGGVLATPIINFPEVAVLGVHKMKETPVVRDGQIVIRTMMNLSISLDHRIVDGYEGAKFLAHVIGLLEDPTLMFMEMV